MKDHIIDGRKHLNFSTFATYDTERQLRKLDESVEMIEKDKMPLETYLLAHQNARLSDMDKKILIKYLKNVRTDTEIRYNTTEQEQP